MNLLFALEAVLYFCVLVTISCIDCKSRKIPNKLLCLMLFFRTAFLCCRFLVLGKEALSILSYSLIAPLLTIAVTVVLFPMLHGSIGAGDFKLLIVCGFCFGIDLYLYTVLSSFVILIGWILIKKKQKESVPFAPFFCIGTLISYIITYILKA